MQVHYESTVDWRTVTDNLRCNPKFFGQPRHDFVILNKGGNKLDFAQLLIVFKCTINNGKTYSIAMVLKYDREVENCPTTDKDLGLIRVYARRRKEADFIFVDSTIRGALLADCDKYDPERYGEKFVVDSLDTDMFIRLLPLHA